MSIARLLPLSFSRCHDCNVDALCVCVTGSYVEVAEVAGAEGGVSDSTDIAQTSEDDSQPYFYRAGQNSFPIVS